MHHTRILLAALTACGTPLLAQDTTPAVDLTLPQAVAQALENNFDLRVQRYEPKISADDVEIEKAAFDIQLTASAGIGSDKDAWTGESYGNGSATVGITKQTATGATIGLETELEHTGTASVDSTNSLYATLTQPLLKGAWADVALAELRKSRSALTVAQMQLRSDALDLVEDVATKYWDYAYASAYAELSQSSVDAAEKLAEETQAKVDAGLASDVDLLQARSSLFTKQETLSQAKQDLAAAGDDLAEVMGSLMDSTGTAYLPHVTTLPTAVTDDVPDFTAEWPKILSEDLSGAMQEETVRQARIDANVARNARKPQLDLTLKAGYSGADYDESGAYDSLADRDGHSWNGALAFSMPFGRREDIAKARQADAQLQQARIQLSSVKQTLYKNARQAWRDIQLAVDRCGSTTSAVDYQQKAFDKAKVQYSRGLISFRELLDSQTDLDNARQEQLDALRDLAVARTSMARLDGTLPDIVRMTDTRTIPTVDQSSK